MPTTATVPTQLVTKARAARMLGVEPRNIDILIRRGELHEARSYPGVRARLRPEDVLALKVKYECGSDAGVPACS